MGALRLFIATDMSDAQRAATLELIEDLRKGARFTKAHPNWVSDKALHVTLKFLGNVEETNIPHIALNVTNRLIGVPPFLAGLQGLGVFPDIRRPKVLWLGVKPGRRQMADLADRVETAMLPLGFERERRAFHPHLTLARIKAQRGVEELMEIVHSHREAVCGAATVDHLTLYQSDLSPTGATYTPLHRWELTPQP